MKTSATERLYLSVDTEVFPLPALQWAAHRLWDRVDCRLDNPVGSCVPLQLAPVPGAGLTAREAAQELESALTVATIQYHALQDTRLLRVLFANAALAPDLTASGLAELLLETIGEMPEVEAGRHAEARQSICRITCEKQELRIHLACGVAMPSVFRALSRLMDVSQPVVHLTDGGEPVAITISLRPGVDDGWWLDAFTRLLVLCRDGGLPACAPSRWSLTETEIFQHP